MHLSHQQGELQGVEESNYIFTHHTYLLFPNSTARNFDKLQVCGETGIYCWGENQYGQCGRCKPVKCKSTYRLEDAVVVPREIVLDQNEENPNSTQSTMHSDLNFVDISTSSTHTLMVSSTGKIYG